MRCSGCVASSSSSSQQQQHQPQQHQQHKACTLVHRGAHKVCTKCAHGGAHNMCTKCAQNVHMGGGGGGGARGRAHRSAHKVCPKCAHGGVNTVMCTRRGSLEPGRHMPHRAEPQAAAIVDRATVGPGRSRATVLGCGQGMMGTAQAFPLSRSALALLLLWCVGARY
jgi:hypothetical protein